MFLLRKLLLSMLIMLTTTPAHAEPQGLGVVTLANAAYRYFKELPVLATIQAGVITWVAVDLVKKFQQEYRAYVDASLRREINALIKQPYGPEVGVDCDKITLSMFEQLWRDPFKLSDDAYICCQNFQNSLPASIVTIALQVAQNMGITDPLIFFQTTTVSHACVVRFNELDKIFYSIGLHSRRIVSIHPKYQHLYTDQLEFYRVLYHELCHVKEKHRIKMWSCADLPPLEQGFIQLYTEMEAELAAIYYLYKNHDVLYRMNYLAIDDDEEHPNHDVQTRYNQLLFDELERDSDLDFAIVKQLALDYLRELAGDDRLDFVMHRA